MRTVRYDRFGGIDQIYIAEMPNPEAAPGQVVVRVHSSGINPGSLAALNGAKFVPARDLAGEVVTLGEGVSNFSVGESVLGWTQDWLAHAQLVAVPANQLIARLEELSWDVAGSLFVTPMAGLAGVKAVEPGAGELIVVSGASGGVGLVSAQLARSTGATVIGLCGSDNNRWLEDHGIIPVVYGDGQEERIRAAAGS